MPMATDVAQGFGSLAVGGEVHPDADVLAADAEASTRLEDSIRLHSISLRVLHNREASLSFLDQVAKRMFAEGIRVRDCGDLELAVRFLIRSRELNPLSGEVRENLAACQANQPAFHDLTRRCFIYPDAERGEHIYHEAILRAVEYVKYSGICGDLFEFGVLAGWTAHMFAETCLDLRYLCDFYLFDSFEGLPPIEGDTDQGAYEIQRGTWNENMDMRGAFEETIGMPIEENVLRGLSTVVSRERVHLIKGFFAETLKRPMAGKASIVHLDCDLYSSTAEVLRFLSEQDILQDGCLLMFDDWNCNRANPNYGQRRALAEFLKAHEGQYDVSPFFSYGFNCQAFILHDLSG